MDSKSNVLVESKCDGNMYPLDIVLIEGAPNICLLSKASSDINWLWHQRLSHLNFGYINKLIGKDLVKGLPLLNLDIDTLCAACEKGKLAKVLHKSIPEIKSTQPLQLLHVDLCGPFKSETAMELINFIKYFEVRTGEIVRAIHSDNGKEFKNNLFNDYLSSRGIEHNFSAPYTPQQNGVVERRNRTLCEAARSMLIFANLPQYFWAEATATTCFTQNRSLINSILNVTPYEAMNKRKPNVKFFHIFGCRCFIKNNKDHLSKFEPRSDEGIFLGYSFNLVAYRVLNKRTRIIEETCDVHFDEYYIRKLDFERFNSQMVKHYNHPIVTNPPVINFEVDFDFLFPQPDTTLDSEQFLYPSNPETQQSSQPSCSTSSSQEPQVTFTPTGTPNPINPNALVEGEPSAHGSIPRNSPQVDLFDVPSNATFEGEPMFPDGNESSKFETSLPVPDDTHLTKWTRSHPPDQKASPWVPISLNGLLS
ncbi:hypothetical protein L1887_01353 [Cichorium endivia]|nr:hypothetical protein L1887_01353 [Cichorium endivia]